MEFFKNLYILKKGIKGLNEKIFKCLEVKVPTKKLKNIIVDLQKNLGSKAKHKSTVYKGDTADFFARYKEVAIQNEGLWEAGVEFLFEFIPTTSKEITNICNFGCGSAENLGVFFNIFENPFCITNVDKSGDQIEIAKEKNKITASRTF